MRRRPGGKSSRYIVILMTWDANFPEADMYVSNVIVIRNYTLINHYTSNFLSAIITGLVNHAGKLEFLGVIWIWSEWMFLRVNLLHLKLQLSGVNNGDRPTSTAAKLVLISMLAM